MTIIHSNRDGFTNFDNVVSVRLSGRFINAEMVTGQKTLIGIYTDDDRAAEVFGEMLNELFPEPIEMASDKVMPFISLTEEYEEPFAFELSPQWYYMPEE